MVTELRIYFEGDPKLRPGFHEFFREIREAARGKRCRFQLIASEGTPVQDYKNALSAHPHAWNVLLLDSDGPVDCSYTDLCRRKGIDGSRENQVFWMVQVMETWFLTDSDALKQYYGPQFKDGALRGNPEVEAIPKADVFSRLKQATAASGPGEYHKTRHAPELLARIDPALVQDKAPNCKRLFKLLEDKLAEP